MGWLSKSPQNPPSGGSSSQLDESSQLASPSDTSPTPSRDELANTKLHTFLQSLQPEPSSTSRPIPSSATTTPSDPTLITPTDLYPSTISCRAAFDTSFYCQSLGGQFNNLYRYGAMRNCSEQWSQFWFCMRTNRGYMDDDERERKVREHYRQREVKYRVGPSSEDVWRPRERRVEGAFRGDLGEDEAGGWIRR